VTSDNVEPTDMAHTPEPSAQALAVWKVAVALTSLALVVGGFLTVIGRALRGLN